MRCFLGGLGKYGVSVCAYSDLVSAETAQKRAVVYIGIALERVVLVGIGRSLKNIFGGIVCFLFGINNGYAACLITGGGVFGG